MSINLMKSPNCLKCGINRRVGCHPVEPKMHRKSPTYLFVGEAPGWQEEKENEPFIGKTGTALRECIAKAGIDIDDCIFSNATWCAPRETPASQIGTPTLDEAEACLPHTFDLLLEFKPKVIIAVGSVAMQSLTEETSITKVHGYKLWLHPRKIPFQTYYKAFLNWAKEHVSEHPLWAEVFDPITEECEAVWQVMIAQKWYGMKFPEDLVHVPVVPVLHPSYALRQGGGRFLESIAQDLVFAKRLGAGVKETYDYAYISSLEEWEKYVDETLAMFHKGEIEFLAYDIETSEENGVAGIFKIPYDPRTRILSMQFSRRDFESRVILVNHKTGGLANDPHTMRVFRTHLKRLMDVIPMGGQNVQFDYNNTRSKLGIKPIIIFDTMLMEHWFKMGQGLAYNLDDIGARYLGSGYHKREMEEWRIAHPGMSAEDAPADVFLRYSAGDADVTRRACLVIRDGLKAEGRWDSYMDHLHSGANCWQVATDLMHAGIQVDPRRYDWLHEHFMKEMEKNNTELQNSPWVRLWHDMKRREWNTEAEEYNKTIHGTRRKARPIYADVDSWIADDAFFNPGSWQQVLSLWMEIMKIPFDRMTDIIYNDHCTRCGRQPCECRGHWPKYKPQKPSTNDHNRVIMSMEFSKWVRQLDAKVVELQAEEAAILEMLQAVRIDELSDEDAKEVTKSAERYAEIGQSILTIKKASATWDSMREVVDLITVHSALKKMNGSFVEGIFQVIPDQPPIESDWDVKKRCFPLYSEWGDWPIPWSIHGTLKLWGTDTGRTSAEDPNFQQFPKGSFKRRKGAAAEFSVGKLDVDVRQIYVSRWAGKGGIWVMADYAQIEVRIMICEAEDEMLAAAVNAGLDIHSFVTSKVYDIPIEKVTKELRHPTKQITFGILYGQGVSTLAEDLHIPYEKALEIHTRFFEKMSKVKGFIDRQHNFVQKNGYVETRLGRRRYLPHIWSEDKGESAKALRDSVNTPIQSAASDLCLASMGRTWQDIKRLQLEALPITFIHDAQGWDSKGGHFFDLMELIYYQMVWLPQKKYPWLICRTEAEFDIGISWSQMVEAKLIFDKATGEIDHEHLDLRGMPADIDAVIAEIILGGQAVTVVKDGPHPKEEEAKKGLWQRIIHVDRKNVKCYVENRELVVL